MLGLDVRRNTSHMYCYCVHNEETLEIDIAITIIITTTIIIIIITVIITTWIYSVLTVTQVLC